ncbi:MAG: nucleotidyltransferase family protein [Chromatiales bacterium]|nr:MAG: nucleotidyltransferase family protein [Chromatiales bacterium]
MKAMLLAAGRGERMRPLTDHIPKPLLEVAGRPLLDYPLARLAQAGIDEVVINLAWHGSQVREFVGDGSRWGLRVQFSDEGPEALETGGGIRQALPLLGTEPFWLVNADVYSDYTFRPRGLADGVLAHLVLVPNPDHHPAGDFAFAAGQVSDGEGQRFTYSGLAVVDPGIVRDLAPGRFPLGPLLIDAAKAGRLTGELHEGLWTDVGTPARLAELERMLGAQTSR